ncbi:MAG: GTP cyclohydrolase I, partial [Dehalococcoidia bacterium]
MIYLSWDDIDARLQRLNLSGVKVWGIPRGGAIAAGLARRFGAVAVDSPEQAEVALDDIIDSGSTAHEARQKYGLTTLVLVNKPAEGITDWVHFPWEEDPTLDITNSVRRILQYLGEDLGREGLKSTPQTVVESWRQLYRGYQMEPDELLQWISRDTKEMVVC